MNILFHFRLNTIIWHITLPWELIRVQESSCRRDMAYGLKTNRDFPSVEGSGIRVLGKQRWMIYKFWSQEQEETLGDRDETLAMNSQNSAEYVPIRESRSLACLGSQHCLCSLGSWQRLDSNAGRSTRTVACDPGWAMIDNWGSRAVTVSIWLCIKLF